MDSITQIVLGAACGEAVLGKKIGNRAMIWGGIGGTIPDFDVFSNLFLDQLDAMTFHRGPMHSLLFACVVPFILGPLVHKLYESNWYLKKKWKITGISIGLLFFGLCSTLICMLAYLLFGAYVWVLIIMLFLSGIVFFRKRIQQIFTNEIIIQNPGTKEWIRLFFWSVFTHPLLDCLTTYGTVLFWPFSMTRISISSISIVDPLYTIPFAVFLLLAALQNRECHRRRWLNWAGVGFSCCYLLFTFLNKQHVTNVFKKSLSEQGISIGECITVPTILNNLLWYCITKTDSDYVYGYYSVLEPGNKIQDLIKIQGNHDVLQPYADQRPVELLKWFSDGYFNVLVKDDINLQYNDLRFGSISGKMDNPEDYIFKFNLEIRDGKVNLSEEQSRPENKKEDIERFKKRIRGEL